MASSFYRKNVIQKAWTVSWLNKSLWFFGLFAAILAMGEEYDVLLRNSDIFGSIPANLDYYRQAFQLGLFSGFGHSVAHFVQTNVPGTLYLLVTWIVAILALAWLVIVAQGALIEGAKRHEAGKSLNLLEGFDAGMINFWPILLTNLVAKVVVYGLLLIVDVPLIVVYIKTASVAAATALMLWTFIMLFPVMIMVSFITKFANAYVVVKKYSVKKSIISAWHLFTRNMLVTVELAALLIVIKTLVVYIAASALINALGFPTISTAEYIFFIVAIGFVYAWLTTFQFSSWTFMFLELEAGSARSKLRRLIHYVLDLQEKPVKSVPVQIKK